MNYIIKKELNIYKRKDFRFDIKNYHITALKMTPLDGDILELGIGDGKFVAMLQNKKRVLYGADIINQNIINTKKKRINRIIKCDLNANLPYKKESFDVIIALEVIEHIYEYKKLISEIFRILRKDGKAIISVPNCMYWRYQIDMFLRQEIPTALIGIEGHVVRYSLKQWKKELEKWFKTKSYATENIAKIMPLPHNITTRYAFFFCKKATFGDKLR